jgi:hypothetical protein
MKAYRDGDFEAALNHFEKVVRWPDPSAPPEYMAFYAQLLILNRRRAEALATFKRIAADESGQSARNADARFAVSYARYVVAYLTGQQDVVARWLDAYRLLPKSGFASRHLVLPRNPILV